MLQVNLEPVWKTIEAGIQHQAFPGAVAAVADADRVIARRAFGHAALEPAPEPMGDNMIFDVASLTKVVATMPAVLLLAEQGELSLDEPVSKFIPAWRGPVKDAVTIRQLLTHTGGLASWYPTFARRGDESADMTAIDVIVRLNLAYEPGTRVEYSCLGYMLLGRIVERITGQRLDQFCAGHVFAPLGMNDTHYRPVAGAAAPDGRTATDRSSGAVLPDASRIVPTERDNVHERGVVQQMGLRFDGWVDGVARGVVHDGNARYGMGGVSGNAGLFSTAADLARYGQEWLKALQGRSSWLSQAMARLATANHTPGLDAARGLGWAVLSDDAHVQAAGPRPVGCRSCGELMTPGSFGHTGFTGTSLWIDAARGLVFVLLTNRVHPHLRTGLDVVRARFHNAAVAALTKAHGAGTAAAAEAGEFAP